MTKLVTKLNSESSTRFMFRAGLLAVAVLIASTPSFAVAETLYRQLEVGSRGSDVSAVQTFLAADVSLYPQGLVTGYFGIFTKSAVTNFQVRNGISAVGRVGPITLAALNSQMGNGTTAVGDVYAPVITSLNVSTGTTVATVTWTTSTSARGKLFYSTSPIQIRKTFEETGLNFVEPTVYGTLAAYDGLERTQQTVTVTNLLPDTTYYYLVESLDASNNVSFTLPTYFHTAR